MKISEVTTQSIIDYLRIDDASQIEIAEIERMKDGAVAYMTGYTGLTETELDDFEDLTDALYILVADRFDNRNMQSDKEYHLNKMAKSILDLHSVNLL